ncbi:DUF4253 domain-containing protein [Streptomyces pluripotens]|uniref:DUF4253 domain-containing protein n=1 Tax=Streptomyces pluripotens TaxID=1355015 RepID=A0A221NYR3_9ACTN|nr:MULTISPECIES: DUF4253 domain-containing protein [Streptomyces]ARP70785.1 hypothetical protein LK06_013345 [Streptomyces pluripotens]ASN25042.1 DUF4253 domain-containing protein [Streptomyces pluripotens]KIE27366.1 hypothetical protein LK08_08250 [Streptomyces sp. MUSC 125]
MATLPNPLPQLITDPSGRAVGLQLPPGQLFDLTDDGPWHEPLLWHAQKQAAPGTWKALGAPASRVGLLPVIVDLGGSAGGLRDWGLLPGETSYPGDHDAEDVLAEYWWEETEGGEAAADIEPFGVEWPGLAPAAALTADPDTRAAQVADMLAGNPDPLIEEPHLALVPARRSADIPAAIGWAGPVNYECDVARLCAVLRSWEDRFGIRVVALGLDTLVVSVAAPPATRAEAEAVAAEHFALCPDTIGQGDRESLQAYAKDLVGAHTWTFWWD